MGTMVQSGTAVADRELSLKKPIETFDQREPGAQDRSNKFLVIGKWICFKTPSSLLFLFWPISLFLCYYRSLRLDQWLISGDEISSKQSLSIRYTGIKTNKNYLSNLAFGDMREEHYLGKIWLWQVNRKTQSGVLDTDLTITETPKKFRKWFSQVGKIYVPSWVVGEIDIPDELTSFIKHSTTLSCNKQKIKNNNLQYQVTNDRSEIMDFLANMYVPYISKVHEDRAVIESLNNLKRQLRKYSLLIIKKDGVKISGCLCRTLKNKAYLLLLGVKEGNFDYVKQGAIGAIYHFSAHYFLEKGYKTINFGKSRAFLKDGVLNSKKKWGQRIIDSSETGFVLSISSASDGVRGFLLNNPFIYMDKDEYKGAIFIEPDQTLFDKFLERVPKDYCMAGMSEVVLFRISDMLLGKEDVGPIHLTDKIVLSSTCKLFPYLFSSTKMVNQSR